MCALDLPSACMGVNQNPVQNKTCNFIFLWQLLSLALMRFNSGNLPPLLRFQTTPELQCFAGYYPATLYARAYR
jgi:hypothetical protein